MMKWLKKKIRNWLNSPEDSIGTLVGSNKASLRQRDDNGFDVAPMHLKIYQATGGTIVESRSYNNTKDHYSSRLHIVSGDQDLGNSISKIITMEALRG